MFEEIKRNWVAARKLAISDYSFVCKANLLGLLKSDIERRAKNDKQRPITDDDCVISIKKLLNGIDTTIELLSKQASSPERDTALMKSGREKVILEDFLPKQMTREEIEKQVEFCISSMGGPREMKDMGKVMKYLTTNFSGKYDGKLASDVVKECLSKG